MKSVLLFVGLSLLSLQNNFKTYEASYYSNYYNGRKTSSGEIFSQKKMTAASNNYRLGSFVEVINIKDTTKKVVVKINDRMSPKFSHRIDLSRAAADGVGLYKNKGVMNVYVREI